MKPGRRTLKRRSVSGPNPFGLVPGPPRQLADSEHSEHCQCRTCRRLRVKLGLIPALPEPDDDDSG